MILIVRFLLILLIFLQIRIVESRRNDYKQRITMLDSAFRMNDIRGKVGTEFSIEDIYEVAQAIAVYYYEQKPTIKTVAVAMDGRTHSLAIKQQLCAGLQDSGLDVIFIGICPSPVLYYALHTMPLDAGIIITASHNPKEYNGLKICLGHDNIWGDAIVTIKKLYHTRTHIKGAQRGNYREQDVINPYINYLVNLFPELKNYNLPFVIDCGNGATGAVIPSLIKQFSWEHVQLLYAEIDGDYPNHEADPIIEENMADVKHRLLTTDAQLGIGFDGDGDRMGAMTKAGYLVPGDQLLALFAKDHLKEYPGNSIVCDIKSSSALLEVIQQCGGKAYLSPSGHSIVKKNMKKYDALLGGELSGHFVFQDNYLGFDDGMYAALRLLSLIKKSHVHLEELLTFYPHKISSPEFRISCDDAKKWIIVEEVKKEISQIPAASMITLDGIRVTLPEGLAVVRASNTQPALSIRFESNTPEDLFKLKKLFFGAMKAYFDEQFLKQQLKFDEV